MRHLRIVTSQRPYGRNIKAKMADFGSDVEFKNNQYCAYDENNWRLTLTTILLRCFGALRPLRHHTSPLVYRPTFWPKLGCSIVTPISCVDNCMMAAFINKSSERCVLLEYGLIRQHNKWTDTIFTLVGL